MRYRGPVRCRECEDQLGSGLGLNMENVRNTA